MIKLNYKTVLTSLVSLTIIACTQAESSRVSINDGAVKNEVLATKKEISMNVEQQKSTKEEVLQWRQATVTFLNLEGGFYGLIGQSGVKLLPMNLEKKYRQHGAVIKFKGVMKKGMMTIQQWGTPFHITEIELVSKGKNLTSSH